MIDSQGAAVGLAAALGCGLLIGVDRERHKGDGDERAAAGLRSFAVVALSGALAQLLSTPGLVTVGAVLVGVLAAVSHWKSRSRDPGMTTELALFAIGGNLAIESLQDTSKSTSKQQSAGGSLSVGFGVWSASANLSSARASGDYASVTEPSGIKAGDGGFDVRVEGHTGLKGAVLSSTQAAVDEGLNSFETASLSTSDIVNRDSAKAGGASLGLGAAGASGASGSTRMETGGAAGTGNASGSQASTTRAGISGVAGDMTVRSEVDGANALTREWDTDRLVADVQGQAQIAQQFGQRASSAWGSYANNQLRDALERNDEEAARCWAADGACRVAGHGVIGGLPGGTSGAAGATAGTALVPSIDRVAAEAGLSGVVRDAVVVGLAGAIGSALGGPAGGAASFNEVNNNYLTSHDVNQLASKLSQCTAGDTKCKEASFVNHGGDLGDTLDDLGSSDSVKRLVAAMLTGGVLQGLNMNPTGLATAGGGAQPFMVQLRQNLTAGAARAVIGTAIHGGGLEENLKEGLKAALLDTVAAQGANAIGDMDLDAFTNKVAHAIAGCAVGAARSDAGCGAGALGAVIGELSAEMFGFDENGVPDPRAGQLAAMLGGVSGALAGLDARQIDLAADAAANAAVNNALKHYAERALAKLADALKALELKPLLEKQQAIREYLEKAGARGGLTDLELSTLGVIYAANEALFPTSVLDVLPGGGKAISKTGTLIKGGAHADEAASVVAADGKMANDAAMLLAARAERFEQELARLPPGKRVAIIKQEMKNVVETKGWEKDARLSRMNNRDAYKGSDGALYSLDTQHGAWERINPKNGAHEGQFRLIDMKQQKIADISGKHDLKVK